MISSDVSDDFYSYLSAYKSIIFALKIVQTNLTYFSFFSTKYLESFEPLVYF